MCIVQELKLGGVGSRLREAGSMLQVIKYGVHMCYGLRL